MQYTYPPLLREIQDLVEDKLGVNFNHVMINLYQTGESEPNSTSAQTDPAFPLSSVHAALNLQVKCTSATTATTRRTGALPSFSPSPSGLGAAKSSPHSSLLPSPLPLNQLKPSVIASLSLGAPRTFHMTHSPLARSATSTTSVDSAQLKSKRWVLENGSLVVQQGRTQEFWKHEIPKEGKVKEGRISLTFRQLVW